MKKDWRGNISEGVKAKPVPPPDGDFFANLTTAQISLSNELEKYGAAVALFIDPSEDKTKRTEALLKFRKDGVEEMSIMVVVREDQVVLRTRQGDHSEMAYAGHASAYNWEILRNLLAAVYNHLKQGSTLPNQLNPTEFMD